VFEIDTPDLIDFKQRTLAAMDVEARCRRTVVAADLRDDWVTPLVENGFRPTAASVWLVEGLLMYLDDSEPLLRTIGELSAPGSHLVLDHAYPAIHRNNDFAVGRSALAGNGSSLASTIAEPVNWLAGFGWTAQLAEPDDIVAGTGRPQPPILDATQADAPIFWFATAVRARE
jgi:methyltransferase (TIGR00027 family)